MGRKDRRIKNLVTALDYEEKWRKQDRAASQATISAYRQMLNALQQDNARLQGKLQRRSRELGIQRAEVKKIDAMFNEAVLGSTQHEYAAATATFMEKSYLQLAERLEKERAVLHRLALIHFTEDEIAKALDDGHIVVDA